MSETPVFDMRREFEAPPALVWRTWTEPDLLARWYGPRVETVIHQFDLKPGGLWLTEMRMNAGSSFQKAEFVEVEPVTRLVFLQTVTDAEWRPTSNPNMPDWPRSLRSEVTLTEIDNGRTALRLLWAPHQPSVAEAACFAAAVDKLGQGWGAGMDLLAELLAELKT